jgi:hypothetical protein
MGIGWSEILILLVSLAALVLAVAAGVVVARRWLRARGD